MVMPMATNRKLKERQLKAVEKNARWLDRFRSNIAAVLSKGEDLRNHYVPRGQSLTKGNKPSLAKRMKPHLKKAFS